MQFEYHYFGGSEISSTASSTGLSFAPDTMREPTFFDGTLSQRIPFREAISALHDVVVSDLRFKPRDKTAYLAWRAAQDELDWATIGAQRESVQQRITALRTELQQLDRQAYGRRREFFAARQKYFDYLYKRDYDAWFVLDPIITVHPDEVFFECFSQDESSYGKLSCGYEVFTQLGERANGTTNVDYSAALYDEFQKIREYKDTQLTVDPQGFDVKTTGEAAYREVKIDLPETWVRGLLQVSSAMTMQTVSFDLHPIDVYNLLFVLRRNKERHGPRSLRFVLRPDAPIEVVLEPWGTKVVCARSRYEGADFTEVRVWGRRRLYTLERLISVAKRFTVHLLGTGMPSFWLADLGDMTFTLGLSGWTANDWSNNANFDLLAPRADVDAATAQRVLDALQQTWLATPGELARKLGLDEGVVLSALGLYTQAGRVIYDLHKRVFRLRELTREPLPMDELRFTSEREAKAMELVARGKVSDVEIATHPGQNIGVSGVVGGGRKPWASSLAINVDGRVTGAECTCDDYVRNKLHRGPCEHILALRLVHQRRTGRVR